MANDILKMQNFPLLEVLASISLDRSLELEAGELGPWWSLSRVPPTAMSCPQCRHRALAETPSSGKPVILNTHCRSLCASVYSLTRVVNKLSSSFAGHGIHQRTEPWGRAPPKFITFCVFSSSAMLYFGQIIREDLSFFLIVYITV